MCSWPEPQQPLVPTPLYLQIKLLFPFLLHSYKREEIPRQINFVKITLQLRQRPRKLRVTAHTPSSAGSNRGKENAPTWNKRGRDGALEAAPALTSASNSGSWESVVRDNARSQTCGRGFVEPCVQRHYLSFDCLCLVLHLMSFEASLMATESNNFVEVKKRL